MSFECFNDSYWFISAQAAQLQSPKDVLDNIRKCKNFLSKLLELSGSQSPETVNNVKRLVQRLVVNVIRYISCLHLYGLHQNGPELEAICHDDNPVLMIRRNFSGKKNHISLFVTKF